MIKRALISVYDKTNIIEFANFLVSKGVEIISTGGTFKLLKDKGVPVKEVAEITGAEEMLDGRVKTLHPIIHGGILAIRENEDHMKTLLKREIKTIDLVCVNLYPFFEKLRENLNFDDMIEFIDIGGPTMLRSAAKNFNDVVVVTDVNDYRRIMDEIDEKGDVAFATKRNLAAKVFNLTSSYDAAVGNYLLSQSEAVNPKYLSLSYEKIDDLRYGENPHQGAAIYKRTDNTGMMNNIEILNGKQLSYNNIKDMDIAWKVVNEFEEIACCALKHNTPCGVAIGATVEDAYKKAYDCDPVSIFGGIVAVNKTVNRAFADEAVKTFLEIIIAPDFEDEALKVLKTKKNLRVV